MALPKDIRPASFRGVEFEAREVSRSVGRRLVTHEFPQRDEPYTEDLGRSVRKWTLQAFIVGTGLIDADKRKQDLIAACEKAGSGKLVHPTEGQMTVRCESCDVTESSDGLNVIEFSLSFVEAGTVFETIVVKKSQASAFAAILKSAVRLAYAARRLALALTDAVRRIISGDIFDKATALLGMTGMLSGVDVSAFIDGVTALRDGATTLVEDADDEAQRWQDCFDSLTEGSDRRAITAATEQMVADAYAATQVAGLSASEQIIRDEVLAHAVMIHVAALASAAEATATETFTAYDDAISALQSLSDRMASVEVYLTDPDTLAAVQDTRAYLVEAVQQSSIRLPLLKTVNIPMPRPALVVAFDLYADADRVSEIIDRNGVCDPNAVVGDLIVLTE